MTKSPILDKLVENLTHFKKSGRFWSIAGLHRLATVVAFMFPVCLLGYVESIPAVQLEFIKTAIAKEPFMEIKLADAILIDQEGRPVKFASQAVEDRIVAINFIYTTCSTVCPLTSAIFKQLQYKLAKHLGSDVWLISISLDPVTDTPARLKEYAARFHPNPGWLWLTGSVSEVERVLTGLGTTSANFREHAPLTLVGDGKSGTWVQLNALTGPEQLNAELERMLAARKRRSRTAAE